MRNEKRLTLLYLALAGFVAAAPARGAARHEAAQPSLISEPVRADSLPPCMSASGGANPAPVPCRVAPHRRAVPQMIERMPLQPPPVHGVQPSPAPPSGLAPPAVPSAPRPLTGCVAGACRDAAGVLYNGGVGNAVLDPNGRLCNRDGAWLQCF